jgi:D-arabinose 1-dehydrogenase-like Zn-dependent alcohol dehydrogenase
MRPGLLLLSITLTAASQSDLTLVRTTLVRTTELRGNDRLLWGERQIRRVTNMTRADARDFLHLAAEIHLRPKVTAFPLEHANEALQTVKKDAIDGAAVITP